jgi:hypothetical protein
MGTYRVFLKGGSGSLSVNVEGKVPLVASLRDVYGEKMGLDGMALTFLSLFFIGAPPARIPNQAAAEAAAIPENRREDDADLVPDAYYLAVDTRPVPAPGGEFPGFPFNAPHPTPHGWS